MISEEENLEITLGDVVLRGTLHSIPNSKGMLFLPMEAAAAGSVHATDLLLKFFRTMGTAQY
jgi:hypothetical protein